MTQGEPAPPWVSRAAQASRIAVLLLLPGLLIRAALGNVDVNDFSIYYHAGRAVLDGADVYTSEGPTGRGYVYPVGFAVLVSPLATLPYEFAAVLWAMLSFAAVFASLWFCLDLLGLSRGAAAWTIGALSLVCAGRTLDSELGNGQANHWVLLGVSACAWLAARGRAQLAGGVLSLAIVAKVTPLLVAVWLVARRPLPALSGLLAGLAAFGVLLPALALGPQAALAANQTWLRQVAGPYGVPKLRSAESYAIRPGRAHGISLRAFVHRHLTRTQAASHHREPVFVNAVAWSPRSAENVYRGLGLLALAAAAFALGSRSPRDGSRWLLEVALVAATMLLVAPLARKAHAVVLLPAFVYAVAKAVRRLDRGALFWVLPPALVFVATAPKLIGDDAAELANAWGVHTAAALWLWAGAAWEALRDRRAGLR
jgi:hypothetical protein